jgi:hypothetical protein
VLAQLVPPVLDQGGAIPNPPVANPPGFEKIMKIVGYIKWFAGLALMAGFLAGVAVFAGGRWIDHHRAGRIGTVMILASLAGALLYGVGYTMISTFAAGG